MATPKPKPRVVRPMKGTKPLAATQRMVKRAMQQDGMKYGKVSVTQQGIGKASSVRKRGSRNAKSK